jgi:molybdate transport system regulatory protein
MSNPRGVKARCKVWLETEQGRVALSDWRVDLLAAVEKHGSLAEAARQLGVPYKTAWYKLKEMEAGLGEPLLVTSSGGASHGSARLTPAGKEAVDRYRRLTAGLHELVEQRFRLEFG